MTARQYAKACEFEVVGKLSKKVVIRREYDEVKCKYVEEKIVFYLDEAGNEYVPGKNGWCIITADGGVV